MTPEDIQHTLSVTIQLLAYMSETDGTGRNPNAIRKFPNWYVGLTDDPDRRRAEHQHPSAWYALPTPSNHIAERVKFLLYDGFTLKSENRGGVAASVYAYVFKLTDTTRPTLHDVLSDNFGSSGPRS